MAIEPRLLESCDPKQIPAREKTKVSQLPLHSLDTVWGIFNHSSYAACGEASTFSKKPRGAQIPAALVLLLDAKLFGNDKFPGLFACAASVKCVTQ